MRNPAVRPIRSSVNSPTASGDSLLEGAARGELELLYAALDTVKTGLLILDRDLRAIYSNPALHGMFKSLSSGKVRKENPHHIELPKSTSSSRGAGGEAYITRRLEWVKVRRRRPG
jgi:hypothetical protein